MPKGIYKNHTKWNEEARRKIMSKLIGHKLSEETKEKIRQSLIGFKHSPEAKLNMALAQIGRKQSPETIEKRMSKTRGKNNWHWKGGKSKCVDCGKLTAGMNCKRCRKCFMKWQKLNPPKRSHRPLTKEHRLKLSQSHMGHFVSMETRKKHRESWIGEKSLYWKGGITPLVVLIRASIESKQWRKQVFERDNYTCQECFTRGKELHAHHIKSFSLIFQEFLKEYNQFSPIEDKETLVRLAINYKPFWEVDNGKTFCKECHKKVNHYWLIPNMRNVNSGLLATKAKDD